MAPERLGRRAREAIEAADEIGVPSVCCWEVGMLVRLDRLKLDREPRAWMRAALAGERVTELPLAAEMGMTAALLADDFPADPADRLIYAIAAVLRAPLATADPAIAA